MTSHNQTAPLEEAKSPLLKVQQSQEALQSAFLKTGPNLKKVLPKLDKLRQSPNIRALV